MAAAWAIGSRSIDYSYPLPGQATVRDYHQFNGDTIEELGTPENGFGLVYLYRHPECGAVEGLQACYLYRPD